MNKRIISNKDLKILSNYLDGQLTAPEQLKVTARLKNEPSLKTALAELKQTRYLLKKAKPITAPRNFTLTPQMAAQIKPARKPFILPVLSISSVLAAILMVFAILFEAFPASNLAKIINNEPRSEFAMEAATEESMPMAEAPMMEDQALAMPDESSEGNLKDLQGNPPIINWGGVPYGSNYGMGGGGEPATGLGGGPSDMMAKPPMETYPSDLVPPEEPVLDLPPTTIEEEPPAEIAPKTMREPIKGTGPILGIPSEEETDIYNQTVFEILEQENQVYQKQQNQIPAIRFLQIGLGLLAIITAAAAVWLSRRHFL